jgi:2-iminobutanoate/2-iminopropanoate deaminase
MSLKHQVISTNDAPKAIGPYSQAIRVGDLVFCSGQIPLDPETGELSPGDARAQARRAMDNLAAVLAAAGSGLAQVVKTTIFLTDLGDFSAVNEVYGSYFEGLEGQYPARACVQVAALPRGARVEIEAIALAG